MKIEEYENLNGQTCVLITYEDGSTWSGLKSIWDEQQAAKEAQSL
jgi:hypothetical protein